jgi:hypothetical protein
LFLLIVFGGSVDLWDVLVPFVAFVVGVLAPAAWWRLRRSSFFDRGEVAAVESDDPREGKVGWDTPGALEFLNEMPVPDKSDPIGFRVKHASLHSVMVTVPLVGRPFRRGAKACPTCMVKHEVKTLHLMLDENGEAVVSHGVMASLKEAGMPFFTEVGHVQAPPPLILAPGKTRAQVDKENRTITVRNMIHG